MATTNYAEALDNFIKSPIKCSKCKQSAINFTINFDELKQEYYSKWGKYCSCGCAMTAVNDENNTYYQSNTIYCNFEP